MIRLLRRLITPHAENEDLARKEFVLNVILTTSISLLIILAGTIIGDMVVTGNHYRGISLGWFLVIIGLYIYLFVLSKRGYGKLSSHIVILIYAVGAIYSGYVWGASLPASLLTFCLVIVTSSALISSRYGIVTTIMVIFIISGLGIHERRGLASVGWKSEAITRSDIVAYAGIILFITAISLLSNSEIEKSLRRARSSEKALADERDNLEITVEERTKALKQSQIEIMNELYRSAEFGKIAQGVFHDLINPLTSVSLNVEQLTRPSTSPTDTKIYIDRAIAVTKKMSAFVSSARKQIQSHDLHEQFSINSEIKDAIDVLIYKARMAGVAIAFTAEAELSMVGNPLKIHQIISNLVSNAIDALAETTKDQKTIRIRLTKRTSTEIQITVQDSGPGIPPATLPHIFDPFYTTKSKEKGTGIGLAIVKHIIEKDFRGTIGVISSEQGTCFTVNLIS